MEELNFDINDLSGEQRELAQTVGKEAYVSLCKRYGGDTVYIAKLDKILLASRNKKIIKEYNGYNSKYLSLKYNLTVQQIHNIVDDDDDFQLSLF